MRGEMAIDGKRIPIMRIPLIRFPLILFPLILFLSGCNSSNSDPLYQLVTDNTTPENKTVLIIGDSLTDYSDGFGLQEKLGPDYVVRVKGIPGIDFPTWTLRLEEALQSEGGIPAGNILVPLGTNDGYRYLPSEFVLQLRRFHERLRALSSARIHYCLMPRTDDQPLAAAIMANNDALRTELPADHTALIDLDSLFQSAAPYPPLYPPEDPVHPTENGYNLIGHEFKRSLTGGYLLLP